MDMPRHIWHLCLLLSAFINVRAVNFSMGQRVQMIQNDCGEICDTAKTGPLGKYYRVVKKDFECEDIVTNPFLEYSSQLASPPRLSDLSDLVKSKFTYDNQFEMEYLYLDDSKGKTHDLKWTEQEVEDYREGYRNGNLRGLYGIKACQEIGRHIRDHMSKQVQGGHVLVIGSQVPWLEAILLEHGAKKVTTLEYVEIENQHPDLEVITPQEFQKRFEDGSLPQFDAMATFSSLEHSGLGRYGDGINPWGDLITMAKAWCVMRPGGRALVGVPVGYDAVLFNGCKLYGPLQLSHLFANFEQIYTEADMTINAKDMPPEKRTIDPVFAYQPIFIIQKPLLDVAKSEL